MTEKPQACDRLPSRGESRFVHFGDSRAPGVNALPELAPGVREVVHVSHARACEYADVARTLECFRLHPRIGYDIALSDTDEYRHGNRGSLRRPRPGSHHVQTAR